MADRPIVDGMPHVHGTPYRLTRPSVRQASERLTEDEVALNGPLWDRGRLQGDAAGPGVLPSGQLDDMHQTGVLSAWVDCDVTLCWRDVLEEQGFSGPG